MNKQKIIIIGLAVGLFLVSQYLILDKLGEYKQQEMVDIYNRGYDKGLTDAVTVLYEQTENCQPSVIKLGNMTKQVFDLACISKYSTDSAP